MSKEKNQSNPLQEFNILETSFGGGMDIEFTEEGFKNEPTAKEEKEEKPEAIEDKGKSKETKEEISEQEEQETPEKEIKESVKVETKEEVSNEDSSLKSFASWLGEKGIVDFDEESFDDSEEGLQKLVVGSIEKGINDYKQSLPEDFHTLLEFVEAGGNPKEFIELYYNNRSWSDFELQDEKSQRFVVEEHLKSLAADDKGNISPEDLEDIKETLDTYEVSGILEKKAKLALNKLQNQEKDYKEYLVEAQKKQAAEQKELAKKQYDEFKDTLYKKEDIQGFKLTPKIKDDLWNFIMKPDKTGKTGLQKHNETNQDAQFLYAYLAMKNWDITALEKDVKNKVSSQLASKLSNFKDGRSKLKSGQTESFAKEKGNNSFSAFRQALDSGAL